MQEVQSAVHAEHLESLQQVAPVAAAARRLHQDFVRPRSGAWVEKKLAEKRQKRQAIVDDLKSVGLRSLDVDYEKIQVPDDEALLDLSQRDYAAKLVDGLVRVPVFTSEQVQRVHQIAEKYNLGVETMGARTSAYGVFGPQAYERARMRGLDGVICLDMPPRWDWNKEDETNGDRLALNAAREGKPSPCLMGKPGLPSDIRKPSELLNLPTALASYEELIVSKTLPIAVVRDNRFPEEGKHRVIAHPTVTVTQVNDFLAYALPSDQHSFQILSDPTSKGDASLGGILATGAQGGNRTSSRVDLLKLHMVDAKGTSVLEGKAAKDTVGLNGYAGSCIQAEFEVTPFPKHPFGLLIPLKGKDFEDLQYRFLQLQHRLAPFCNHPGSMSQLEGDKKMTTVTSLELLGPEQLRMGIEHTSAVTNSLRDFLPQDASGEYNGDITTQFVYLRGFSTVNGNHVDQVYQLLTQDLFTDALEVETTPSDEDGAEMEPDFNDDGSLVLRETEGDDRLFTAVLPLLNPSDEDADPSDEENMLLQVDKLRHSAPEIAKSKANALGGKSKSMDFNIRFKATDPEVARSAHQKVAKLIAWYHDQFTKNERLRKLFRIDYYGHLFPGMVESPDGGGFDPHIRMSLRLNDPEARNDSPELVRMMASVQAKFYQKLYQLNGIDGIVVAPPEKSHLNNSEYIQWRRLYDPEWIPELEEVLMGDTSDPEALRRKLASYFRFPLEMPKEPRRGMRAFLNGDFVDESADPTQLSTYAPALLEIAQHSHRGWLNMGMCREVVATLREKLHLDPYTQHPFFIESPAEGRAVLERNLGEEASNYTVVEIQEALDLDQIAEDAFSDPNTVYLVPAEYMGGLKGMTVMVTPHKAILDADRRSHEGANRAQFRNLVKMFRSYPYETAETPQLMSIAALGVALQRDELALDQPFGRSGEMVSVNAGPTQIDLKLFALVQNADLQADISSEQQQADLASVREFLRLPESMTLGTSCSSTQMMQHFADALRRAQARSREDAEFPGVNVVQVTNGAFSERLHDICAGLDVTRVTTPWATAEGSWMRHILDPIADSIRQASEKGEKSVLFVTPHKTSTTAHFMPEQLLHALADEPYGLRSGEDFELVCDLTSGLGAIDYFQGEDLPGVSFFASSQKAMGCPPGLGMCGLSPSLKALLLDEDPSDAGEHSLQAAVSRTENGDLTNPLLLRMMGERCRQLNEKGRTVSDIQSDTRRKLDMLLGFQQLHPELCMLVPNADDQSPILTGLYSNMVNLGVAKRIMAEVFGYDLGGGYGPYADEAIRIYLPHISEAELQKMLMALHYVLQLPEVIHAASPSAPLVALRELHDAIAVVQKFSEREDITPDDILRDELGLRWVGRLVHTISARGQKTVYGSDENAENVAEIKRLLGFVGEEGGRSVSKIYGDLRTQLNELRRILLRGDEVELDWYAADSQEKLMIYVREMYMALKAYSEDPDTPKTENGLVKWAIAATPEQLYTNGKSH